MREKIDEIDECLVICPTSYIFILTRANVVLATASSILCQIFINATLLVFYLVKIYAIQQLCLKHDGYVVL